MSVKITVVFTILIITVLQYVSSALEQQKDYVLSEIQSAGDEMNSDYDEESEENFENADNYAEEYYRNLIREYNYGTDLLYSGQKQSGQLNSNGKNIVTGEYYFVENGKEYKVSYVADENGYRPKYSAMETTKDSPPTYQGKKETGEYTFQKNDKRYKIKYVIDENGFRPTEIEVKPLPRPPPPPTRPPPARPPPVPYDPLIVASLLGGG